MSPFSSAPEFIELDNRRFRASNPVTAEQMHNKHEVLFPSATVTGKKILDLGCGIGATGHWCLSNGAANYTGVEVQKEYAENAAMLMQKYHAGAHRIETRSIEEFLAADTGRYDIVSALAVLHVFTDYYTVLKHICMRAQETVVIEELRPDVEITPEFCGVQFLETQSINLANENASLTGRGIKLSPAGLSFLMREFGFESSEGVLYPKPITGSKDAYNPPGRRYLMRFSRIDGTANNLSQDLQTERAGKKSFWRKFGI